jgi:hypothetical protein
MLSEFKVGDKVSWRRAVEWNLKDTTGVIVRVFTQGRDQQTVYLVKFPFGIVQLHARQIDRLSERASNGKGVFNHFLMLTYCAS